MSRIARRGFLLGAGGVAGALGWWLGVRTGPSSESARLTPPLPASPQPYVDHDGWMVSVEDKATLAGHSDDSAEIED